MFSVESIVEQSVVRARDISDSMFQALCNKKSTPSKEKIASNFLDALFTLGDMDVAMDLSSKLSKMDTKKEMICFVWAKIYDISEDVKKDSGLKTGADAFQEWIDSVSLDNIDTNIPF